VKRSVGNYAEAKVSSQYRMEVFEEERSMSQAERQARARTMSEEEQRAQRARFLFSEELADALASDSAVTAYDKVLTQNIELKGITNPAVQSMLAMRRQMQGREGVPQISSSSFPFEGNTDGASAADFLEGKKVLVSGSLYTYRDHLEANPVVVVEKNLAEENGLGLEDTVTAVISGKSGASSKITLTVIGIYRTEEAEEGGEGGEYTAFNPAGSTFYAPLSVVQELADVPGYVSLGSYHLDSVDSIGKIAAAFSELTGGDTRYQLDTGESSYEAIADPLNKTSRSSTIGLVGALAACALIILLAMAIVVGGRTRELGVLKAIGATDRQVVAQFAAEVVCICLVATVLAGGAAAVVGQRMGDWLMSGNTRTDDGEASQSARTGPEGFPAVMRGGGLGGEGLYLSGEGSDEEVDLHVIWRGSMFLYGMLLLLILSLLGMAVPVIWITRLRPARVLSIE